MVKNKKAFTLVELLAVIVILAVILVIAVPSIMDTIKESRKGALASSAKLIASSAETAYMSNQTLGIEKTLTCQDVSSYKEEDYTCNLEFVGDNAYVTLEGSGKFDGLYVCSGTKEDAEASEEACTGGSSVETVSFEEDSWTTIKAAVSSGNTDNYNVGDTKTVDLGSLGTHTVRIANKTACDGTLASQTACGFVIEFADIITEHNMNPSEEYNGTNHYGSNKDGWPASSMYDYVNGDIYNALPEGLRNAIIDTTVVSSLGYEDKNRAEGNFVSTDKLYLLSPEEVYGTSFTDSYDTSRGTSRQLDYYANNNVSTTNYSVAIKTYGEEGNYWWWLRSANSSYVGFFFRVTNTGDWSFTDSYNSSGVSPAFRIG